MRSFVFKGASETGGGTDGEFVFVATKFAVRRPFSKQHFCRLEKLSAFHSAILQELLKEVRILKILFGGRNHRSRSGYVKPQPRAHPGEGPARRDAPPGRATPVR